MAEKWSYYVDMRKSRMINIKMYNTKKHVVRIRYKLFPNYHPFLRYRNTYNFPILNPIKSLYKHKIIYKHTILIVFF